MQSVVGIFPSIGAAEESVEELRNSGMTEQSIVLLSSESPSGANNTWGNMPEDQKQIVIARNQQNDQEQADEEDEEVDRLTTTDAESDGMGKTMGALMGGAVGASAGLAAGSAIASLMVPGVGTIFAIGLGAAAVLGLGGAAAGAKAGEVTEHALDVGVPRDDVPFYHELLRRGRSLVIANVEDEDQAATTKLIFRKQGSEDVDEARRDLGKAA